MIWQMLGVAQGDYSALVTQPPPDTSLTTEANPPPVLPDWDLYLDKPANKEFLNQVAERVHSNEKVSTR